MFRQSGYSLKLGIPCKGRTLSAFSSAVSSSLLCSWQLLPISLLYALGFAAAHQGKFNYHWLPSCLPACLPLACDILVGILSWAKPIFWIMNWSLCQLARSGHQPQNVTAGGAGGWILSGVWDGAGRIILSLAIISSLFPFFYVTNCYFSSLCKMLSSHNFKSAFPAISPSQNPFYMEILGPQDTVETGKWVGRPVILFSLERI